jgi:hypothetical protein
MDFAGEDQARIAKKLADSMRALVPAWSEMDTINEMVGYRFMVTTIILSSAESFIDCFPDRRNAHGAYVTRDFADRMMLVFSIAELMRQKANELGLPTWDYQRELEKAIAELNQEKRDELYRD